MNAEDIVNELTNVSYRHLATEILDTINKVKNGTKNYKQGMVELQGYKQVIQLIALEMMRNRVGSKLPMRLE